MKRLCLLVASLLIMTAANAQTWDWAWEKDAGGAASEELGGQSVSDITGNTYVIGNFQSPLATFSTATVTLNGTRNMFVAKYNSIGNIMWAKSPAAGNDNRAFAVAIDPNGTGIFVVGTYVSSVTFGAFTLSNPGGGMYIVKYDNSGNAVWAHDAVATGSSSALSVAADAWGNCYVSGEYQGPSITFGATTLTNLGLDSFDMFLVKYNSSGNVVWAKNGGGTHRDGADAVSVGASGTGDVYVTGYFASPTATFGAVTITNGNTNLNTFLVKYDTSGNAIWGRKSVGNTGMNGTWIAAAIDPAEDVYVSGSFTGTNVVFDTITLTNANSSSLDAFLVQYDSAGNIKWGKRFGGSRDDVGGVTVDQNFGGRIFLTGFYASDSINIDTVTLHNTMTNGTTDIFVAGFDDQWNSFMVKGAGGKLNDYALSCSSHGVGDMYVAGMFTGQYLAFGADTIENNAIDSTGDIFVAKLAISTGVHELPQQNAGILVYPNPAKDLVKIQLPATAKESTISLLNITGQAIKVKEDIAGQTRQLDLNGLAPGLYILQLKSETGVQYFKIMHQP